MKLEEHQKDIHGEKVRCGVCTRFIFPKSCWRLYREHHHDQHPEQGFVEYLPLDYKPPQDDMEEWEIPPEGGFLELGEESPLYSPISSDSLISTSEWAKGQSWGFTSRSTARVILGQVLRIATCGTRTHRGDSL